MIYHAGDRIEMNSVPGTVKGVSKEQFLFDCICYDVIMDSGYEYRLKSTWICPLTKRTEFLYLKRQKNLSPEKQAYMKQLEEELAPPQPRKVEGDPALVEKKRKEQEALRRKAARKYGLQSLKGGEKK